ncbi:MAG: phosphodiester glycosidase family protein [Myxococcota bacterium]|jgi:hypothetical protein|nr:phosphodiester glycosidase family protein [Myxococcota bacterium]
MRRIIHRDVFGLLTLAALLFALPAWAADEWSDPYPGVRILHRTTSEPNEIWVASIELCERGIGAVVTSSEDRGLATSAFARRYGAQLAINGGFYNMQTLAPLGLVVSNGAAWPDSADTARDGFLSFTERNRPTLSLPELVVPFEAEMHNLIPGMPMLVEHGQALNIACTSHYCERHPRTAVGLDQSQGRLLLAVVDGRRSSSRGMTCAELASLMVEQGAYTALNLDGGGSSTFYVEGMGGVLNTPSGGVERNVANHLGLFAGGSTDYARCCIPTEHENPSSTFLDVPAGSWQDEVARTLWEYGISNGCQAEPPMFCPDCDLSRIHAAIFLARAAGIAPLDNPTPTYQDLPRGSFGYGEVEALSAMGVFTGCSNSPRLFCPEDGLSRAGAAAIVVRTLGLPGGDASSFEDVAPESWYYPLVEAAKAYCLVSGCSQTPPQYCPNEVATRIEFGSILVRAFELGTFRHCGPHDPEAEESPEQVEELEQTEAVEVFEQVEAVEEVLEPLDGEDLLLDSADTESERPDEAEQSDTALEPDAMSEELSQRSQSASGGCCRLHAGGAPTTSWGVIALALLALVLSRKSRRQ